MTYPHSLGIQITVSVVSVPKLFFFFSVQHSLWTFYIRSAVIIKFWNLNKVFQQGNNRGWENNIKALTWRRNTHMRVLLFFSLLQCSKAEISLDLFLWRNQIQRDQLNNSTNTWTCNNEVDPCSSSTCSHPN